MELRDEILRAIQGRGCTPMFLRGAILIVRDQVGAIPAREFMTAFYQAEIEHERQRRSIPERPF